MHAVFGLQIAVGVIPFHLNGAALDTGFFPFQEGGDGIFVTVSFAPAQIHAHEHGAPVVGFRTACAGIDGEDGAQVVTLIAQHIPQFQGLHGLQRLRIGLVQFFSFGGFPRFLLGPVKTIFREFVQHFQIIGKAAGFVEVRNPGFDAGEFFQEGFRGFGISPKVRRQRLFRFGGHFLPFSGNIQAAVQGCHPFL